jgi:hypothetical protein
VVDSADVPGSTHGCVTMTIPSCPTRTTIAEAVGRSIPVHSFRASDPVLSGQRLVEPDFGVPAFLVLGYLAWT